MLNLISLASLRVVSYPIRKFYTTIKGIVSGNLRQLAKVTWLN